MTKIHHSAICVGNIEASLRFWQEGLGFVQLMDSEFEGDWPALFAAGTTRLRSVFLGDPADQSSGIVELVDFGAPLAGSAMPHGPTSGFFLLSVVTDVNAALARLDRLGLGGTPRRTRAYGVDMAVVVEPSGVRVELIDRDTAELSQ